MNNIKNTKSTTFAIYSMKLAGKLMTDGFVLCGMQKNKKNNNYNVFYFCDTPEIKAAIKKYTNR